MISEPICTVGPSQLSFNPQLLCMLCVLAVSGSGVALLSPQSSCTTFGHLEGACPKQNAVSIQQSLERVIAAEEAVARNWSLYAGWLPAVVPAYVG